MEPLLIVVKEIIHSIVVCMNPINCTTNFPKKISYYNKQNPRFCIEPIDAPQSQVLKFSVHLHKPFAWTHLSVFE